MFSLAVGPQLCPSCFSFGKVSSNKYEWSRNFRSSGTRFHKIEEEPILAGSHALHTMRLDSGRRRQLGPIRSQHDDMPKAMDAKEDDKPAHQQGASWLVPILAATLIADTVCGPPLVIASNGPESQLVAEISSDPILPADSLASAFEAYNEGRLDQFLEHFAPNFNFTYLATPRMPFSGNYKGQDGLLRAVMGMEEVFKSELTSVQVVGDKESAVAVANLDWTQTNKRTGKTFVNKCLYWEQQNEEGKAISAVEACNSLMEYEATLKGKVETDYEVF